MINSNIFLSEKSFILQPCTVWKIIEMYSFDNFSLNFTLRSLFQLYQQEFEERLLTETSEFYRAEASHFLTTCNCSQYMQKVKILTFQQANSSSIKFVTQILHDNMIHLVIREIGTCLVLKIIRTQRGRGEKMRT